jgi:hypothetical protein
MELPSLQQNLTNQESAHTLWHSFQTAFAGEESYLAFGHTLYTSTIYELETDAVRIEEGDPENPEHGSPSFPLLSRVEEHCAKCKSLKETAERVIQQLRRIDQQSHSSGPDQNEWTVLAERLYKQALVDLDSIRIKDGDLFTEKKSMNKLVTIRINLDELVVATDPQNMETDLQESFNNAIWRDDTQLVELLLEDERVTPLIHQCYTEHMAVLPIGYAISCGNLKTAKLLIADSRVRESVVSTITSIENLLIAAIDSRKIEMVQFVLGLDFFDPSVIDWGGVFGLAFDDPQLEIIRELMAVRYASGNLCVDPTCDNNSALRTMCERFASGRAPRYLEIIKLLLTNERLQQSLIVHNFYDEPYYGVMNGLPEEISELFSPLKQKVEVTGQLSAT